MGHWRFRVGWEMKGIAKVVFQEIDFIALDKVLKKHESKARGLDFEIGEVVDKQGKSVWKGQGRDIRLLLLGFY
jgi:tetrahydromethanopterin S-methyltransferase subunit G